MSGSAIRFWVGSVLTLLAAGFAMRPGEAGADSIAGVVVTAGDAPVAGARIEAFRKAEAFLGRRQEFPARVVAKSDGGGLFEFQGLPASEYSLLIQAEGLAPLMVEEIAIREPGSKAMLLELGPGGRVAGKLRGAKGQALAGAKVGIYRYRLLTTTDEAGSYELDHVPSGAQVLEFRAPQHARGVLELQVLDQETSAAGVVHLRSGLTLSGQVVDERERAVESALVRLRFNPRALGPGRSPPTESEGQKDWSAADGTLLFTDLDLDQEYFLVAYHPDFADTLSPDFALSDELIESGFGLVLRSGGVLHGSVEDLRGAPIAGAEVWVEPPSGRWWPDEQTPRTASLADGSFELQRVPRENVVLRARADEYLPAPLMPLDFSQEPSEPISIVLEPGLSIKGSVVGPAGEPIAGAEIQASVEFIGTEPRTEDYGRFDHLDTRSQFDGTFALTGLPDRRIGLQVSAPSYADAIRTVPAGREGLRIEMEPAGAIRVRVIQEDGGSAVCDARITVLDRSPRFGLSGIFGRRYSFHGQAELPCNDGWYSVSALPPATYEVQVMAPSLAPQTIPGIVVKANAPASELTIKLGKGASIRGRVLRADDHGGIPGASIELWRDQTTGHNIQLTKSDPEGRFVIQGVAAGSYRLAARHPEYLATQQGGINVRSDEEVGDIELICDPGGWIEGTVYDAGRSPRPRAEVQVFASVSVDMVLADALGHYQTARLQPGTYRVSAPGETQPVEVRSGQGTLQDLGLSGVSVHGLAFDQNGPLSRRELAFSPEDDGVSSIVGTDGDGNFDNLLLQPGAYSVSLIESRAAPFRAMRVTIPDVPEYSLTLQFASGSIRGRAVSDIGLENGFGITLTEHGAGGASFGLGLDENSGGEFEFRRLPPATYSVRIESRGNEAKVVEPIHLSEGQQLDLGDVHLDPAPLSSVEVQVQDESGLPAAGVAVYAWALDRWALMGQQHTDAAGRCVLTDLELGNYSFVALAEGFRIGRSEGVVGAESRATLIALQSPAGLELTVVGPDAAPLAGVGLHLVSSGDQHVIMIISGIEARMLTDQHGRARLNNLPPGDYQIFLASGFPIHQSVTLESGRTTSVQIELAQALTDGPPELP